MSRSRTSVLFVTAAALAALAMVAGGCQAGRRATPAAHHDTGPSPTARASGGDPPSPTPAATTETTAPVAPAPPPTSAAPLPQVHVPAPAAQPAPPPRTTRAAPPPPPDVYYANCAAVRAAGKAPLYRGQPGYRPGLDRDGDGVACE